jgi:hypothetical protein
MTEVFDDKVFETSAEETYVKTSGQKINDDQQVNIMGEFLKQLKPGVELFRIQVPIFLIQPVSFLEKMSTYSRPNSLILSAPTESDSEKRFLKVLGWVLSNWSTVPRKGIVGSKPLNPIIGEVFKCSWDHEDSKTEYVAEQVSHHPPITALYCYNEKLGFAYSGHVFPKTSFSVNSVEAVMEGQFRIDLIHHKEQYNVIQPCVSAGGLFFGEQTIEIYDKCVVMNQKYCATIDFYLGKNNQLDGSVIDRKTKERLYSVSGNINDKVHYTNQKTAGKKTLFDSTELKVVPLGDQAPNDSRRNWYKTIAAMNKGDMEKAVAEKNEVEERERALRKEHKEIKPSLFIEKDKKWMYTKSVLGPDEDFSEKVEDSGVVGYFKSWFN